MVAAYVLAVGVKGLQLAGLPTWIPHLSNGAALLVAVGLAAWRRTATTRKTKIRRLWGVRSTASAEGKAGATDQS